ncbi:RusA family crossover junction endodeoxyribonuclease, partial [Rhodococcus sp. UNC363MFTsu5.1]|uniref:RusA family crossover junction endodeoxyribonuclease n=1 Tax=Rhodococcus sp. UNC363MFTsu5.1 TaxID=1449069 RepID=UPI00056D72F2
IRGGKVYHYKDSKTTKAQDLVSYYFRAASGPVERGEGGAGVSMLFYVGKRQRRDVDNFVKLVLDGLTGYAWKDDSQVTEISAKVIHGSDSPRSEVHVYPTDDLPDRFRKECERCGKGFQCPPAHQPTRRFCSQECRTEHVRMKRERTCEQCGTTYRSATGKQGGTQRFCSTDCKYAHGRVEVTCAGCGTKFEKQRSANRAGNTYCTDECRASRWREHRKKAAKGTCVDCGGATSKKSYERCMACRIINDRNTRAPKEYVA